MRTPASGPAARTPPYEGGARGGGGASRTGDGGPPPAAPPDAGARPLVSFGHGTLGRAPLAELLHGAGVCAVVDVRTAPGSRRNPDVHRDALGEWLPAAGADYRWEPRLGGFRRPAADSPDTFWRNASFRGYAGHTRRPEFLAAMDELMDELTARPADGPTDGSVDAAGGRTAVMCSEALWWRCHRRIIADFAVLVRGVPVLHLSHDGRLTRHAPVPEAHVLPDGLLVYPAP